MTYLKKTRSMLAATALLCGMSPATSAMGQTNIQGGSSFAPVNAGGCAPITPVYGVGYVTDPRTGCLVPVRPVTPVAGSPLRPYTPWVAPVATAPQPPRVQPVSTSPYSGPPPAAPGSNCAMSPTGVMMMPCAGTIGTPIQVRLPRDLGSKPAYLQLYVPGTQIPAVRLVLAGSGLNFSTRASAQLCAVRGQNRLADLILENGQPVRSIGDFTCA